jgi:hypothetical protein
MSFELMLQEELQGSVFSVLVSILILSFEIPGFDHH